jgi:hypothetical protein
MDAAMAMPERIDERLLLAPLSFPERASRDSEPTLAMDSVFL